MFKRSSPHRAAPLLRCPLHGLYWLLEFSVVLLFAACGGATPQAGPTEALLTVLTATPTILIVLTATPTGAPTLAAATSIPSATSEPTDAPTVTSTPEHGFTVTGSDEIFSEGNSSSYHGTVHTLAVFSLKTVGGNQLKGTAEITFRQKDDFYDTTCEYHSDSGTLSWKVDLDGQYEKQTDGSLFVTFANGETPKFGPSFKAKSCSGDLTVAPTWGGAGAVLINGHYNQRKDLPCSINAQTTCQAYRILIMDVTDQK